MALAAASHWWPDGDQLTGFQCFHWSKVSTSQRWGCRFFFCLVLQRLWVKQPCFFLPLWPLYFIALHYTKLQDMQKFCSQNYHKWSWFLLLTPYYRVELKVRTQLCHIWDTALKAIAPECPNWIQRVLPMHRGIYKYNTMTLGE